MTQPIILAFEDYINQASSIADLLGLGTGTITVHHFPDRESMVNIPETNTDHVIICRSLFFPNDKLIELFLGAKSLKQNHNIERITLVTPYMPYMRQDIEFNPGDVVSQQIIGHWLAEFIDDIITVDPHLHRIKHLSDAIPLKNAIALTATEPMSEFIQQRYNNAVVIGPDSESRQWVASIAERIGFEHLVANKVRTSDTEVSIELPEFNYNNRTCVIVDDIASSGHTLANCAQLLLQRNAASVDAIVTHALFCNDAENIIRKAGVNNLWSTDSVPHASNAITLAHLLANALKTII
jgi:ribose-phosphate pyrophosphokinase